MTTASLQFDETMTGHFALGAVAPHEGAIRGKASDTILSMQARVRIPDVKRFVADPEHLCELSGRISFPPLGIDIESHGGVCKLFTPTHDPALTYMVYELAFRHDGQEYYLAGRKHVKDDHGFDVWSDTTTLYTCLHKGTGIDGEIVGAGVLTLGVRQLLSLLASMTSPDAKGMGQRAAVFLRFGTFFARQILTAYGWSKLRTDSFDSRTDTDLHYDVIVIGSGFGGAVTACRLAERGLNVCILERGRRWGPANYPRGPADPWWWSGHAPTRYNGWIDLQAYPNMAVAQGCGVGGGSLIYANIFVEPDAAAFSTGWPEEITYAGMRTYYERTGQMLHVQEVPDNQWPPKMQLLHEAAERAGYKDRFRKLPLAVNFDQDYSYLRPDPHADSHSKPHKNALGLQQGTCVHCGNCDIGCQVQARNTLDMNYLPLAERHGTVIKPLHLVTRIMPLPNAGGYRVDFQHIDPQLQTSVAGHVNATRIILAAGTMGTNELLLRCRDQYKTLPKLSRELGKHWSSNGDFLTPAIYPERVVAASVGPTITAAIDFLDRSFNAQRFWVQDGGFPNLLKGTLGTLGLSKPLTPLTAAIDNVVSTGNPLNCIMPWFGQAEDAADGHLSLVRSWIPPFRHKLHLHWDVGASRAGVQALVDMHKRLSVATGGIPHVPASWEVFKDLVTPHPLGGCRMGRDADNGVVDHKGEVFNYPGLYVADGALVPKAIGINPSRTIAALAERIAELMPI